MSDPRLNDPFQNRQSIDPNDPAPHDDPTPRLPDNLGGRAWGWIAGLAVLALIGAIVFGGSNGTQVADEGTVGKPSPYVTRSDRAPAPQALPNATQRPAPAPSETTGSGSSTTGSGSSGQ